MNKIPQLDGKMADSNEIKLKNGPEDGITAVQFGPTSSPFLLVSSWDCSVRLYDCIANNQRLKYNHERSVLDVCFQVLKAINLRVKL